MLIKLIAKFNYTLLYSKPKLLAIIGLLAITGLPDCMGFVHNRLKKFKHGTQYTHKSQTLQRLRFL